MSFLSVKGENVLLSTLYHEKNNFFTRIYETKGEKGKATLGFFKDLPKAWEVKLNRESIRSLSPKKGKVSFTAAPWKIYTIKWKNP